MNGNELRCSECGAELKQYWEEYSIPAAKQRELDEWMARHGSNCAKPDAITKETK